MTHRLTWSILLRFCSTLSVFALGIPLFVRAQTCPAPPSANSAAGGFVLREALAPFQVVGPDARICAGATLTVTDTSGAANIQYWYEHTGTAVPTAGGDTARRHTFSRPGRYVIIQQGSRNGTGSYACQTIEVLPSPAPVLTVNVCALGQVRLTIPAHPNNVYAQYAITWMDGGPEVLVGAAPQNLTYTYANPSATYNITIRTLHPGGFSCNTISQAVNPSRVTPVRKPVVTRLTLTDATTATLEYAGQAFTPLEIYQQDAAGTYRPTGLISNTATAPVRTFSGLDSTRSTCFKVIAVQGCGTDAESDPICTLPLRVEALDLQNQISWPPHAPTPALRGYSLSKNGTALPFFTGLSLSGFLDTQAIVCGQSYCYQLTAQVGTAQSVSNRVCVVARSLSVPPVLQRVHATIERNQVNLYWDAPAVPASTFRVFRAANGAAFGSLAETTTLQYTDATAQPASQAYCYRVTYRNSCATESAPSDPVCPIRLTQNGTQLAWSPQSPFTTAPGTYVVQLLDASGAVVADQNTGSTLTFEPPLNTAQTSVLRYRVQTTSAAGQVSWSNELLFSLPIRLFVPDVFTPNGDGINDLFNAETSYVGSYRLRIFNRWGESVYSSTSTEGGWDGTLNGQPAPPGNYSYRIDVTDLKGQPFTKRGLVQLVR
jgi:gliding motility-associated-like protein